MVRSVGQHDTHDGERRYSAVHHSGNPKQARRGFTRAAEATGQPRDTVRSQRVIKFIEQLRVPSGYGQGEQLVLRDWQKDFIRDIYEPVDQDGFRIVRRAINSMARKNGKTLLVSALVLVHLIGPEAIENDEIYSAANDRKQAALVFKTAAQMVRADHRLSSRLNVIDSTKRIVNVAHGSFYEAMSAESGTKHGLNPSFVVYDELAQAKNRKLYDVLDTSMGARREPLFAVISTQSNDPQHILSQLIDDAVNGKDPTIVCHLYEVPEEVKDIWDPVIWRMANPALGDFLSLDNVKAMAAKAQRMPAEEPKFRNLVLNQRVSPISTLISRFEWAACAGDANIAPGEEMYFALDLSSVRDITALVGVTVNEPVRVLPIFFKPIETLHEHSKRDFGSGNNHYVHWYEQKHLQVTAGGSIDPLEVADHIAQLSGQYSILGLAFDRWRINDLLRAFDQIGFRAQKEEPDNARTVAGLRLIPWGQGFRDMAPAVDAMELLISERRLLHPNNPALNWMMMNAMAVADPAGNRKIDKSATRFRIDGAVALAMACGARSRERAKPKFDAAALIA